MMNRLLFVLLQVVVVSRWSLEVLADQQQQQLDLDNLPEYPGHDVYLKLENYLQDKVKSEALEANFKQLEILIKDLESEPVKALKTIHGAQLVLVLKTLFQLNRCNAATAAVFELNLKGVAHLEQANQTRGQPEPSTRVSFLILTYMERIAENCETNLVGRLEKAIKSVVKNGYRKLSVFLNRQFLLDWQQSDTRLRALKLNKMNPELDWTKRTDLGQGMILGKLVDVSDGDKLIGWRSKDDHRSVYQHYSAKRWPKLTKIQLKSLVRKHLVTPCTNYLKEVDENVLRLFYLAAKHLGDKWAANFVARRSEEVRFELFKYEFCHIEQPNFTNQLWLSFRQRVYPNMAFGSPS